MSPTVRARLELLAAGLLFSTGGAAIKLCRDLGGVEIAGLRSAVATLALLLLVPGGRRWPSPSIGLVSLAFAATLGLFAVANRMTTAANCTFLQGTAPAWLMVFGPLILGERLARKDVAVFALLAVGMSLFFVASDEPSATAPDPETGDLLATASGLTWALTLLGMRALGRSGRVGQPGATAAVTGSVLSFALLAPFFASDTLHAGASDWAVIGYLGVFQVAMPYALITRAVPHLAAFEVSLLLMSEPAFSPIWAWLVHGELPQPLAVAGGAVIFATLVLRTLLEARRVRFR